MAIYHMSIKIGSRAKGKSAIAAAAYRAGDILKDKETGITADFSRKGGVVYSEISLCKNAPAEYADRATLWNSVHEIEKAKNAQLWREFEVALPKELDRAKQILTVQEFVKLLTEQGMCADWSLHDKGDGNPHAHIMATMRSITANGKWAPKGRKVYDLDENGERIFQKVDKTGRKQYKCHKEDYNDWNKNERVEEWRAAWAACCNARLAERDRIDHRSYQRQGIEQEPTIHEGYVARKIKAEGGISERININNEIKSKNSKLRELAEQLRKIEQQLTELLREKGSALNERVAELLARRKRTVDSGTGGLERGIADGERAAESRTERAAPTETDRLIRESEIERRTALRNIGLEKNENAVSKNGNAVSGDKETTELVVTHSAAESEAVLERGEAALADSRANRRISKSELDESKARAASAAAHRAEREAERERLAAENRRRIEETKRKARETSERARKTSHNHDR